MQKQELRMCSITPEAILTQTPGREHFNKGGSRRSKQALDEDQTDQTDPH
jgi:hypothetical protein